MSIMQIYGFSLIRIFPYMSLDSVHIWGNVGQRKPLYVHVLCSVCLSLWLNVGTTFLSVALAELCARSTKLAALTSSITFFLVATSNSVHHW